MTIRAPFSASTALLILLALVVSAGFATSSASAASLVAKDGKIHACYKAKGKGKGTLRVVRNGKVRCPKKWKKVAWAASSQPGPQGQAGPAGAGGAPGDRGLPGTAGNVVVEELEDKVTELLTKVANLETILKGINNTQLKEAIAALANVEALETVVGSLCSQSSTLTGQLNSVESALGGLSLNAVLTTLGGALNVPTLPGALPAYSCPS